jgi:hypothetical protein
MKKTLICNGCSFMAGDELVWEQYNKEQGKEARSWNIKFKNGMPTDTDTHNYRMRYIKYRGNYNLAAQLSNLLNCERIDLSSDGKSNQAIAIETIAFLDTLPKEERKNYHAIIGWTCLSRVLKYSKSTKQFVDLTVGHYDESAADPARAELKEHIKVRIIDSDDEDYILDYISNVMMLENYLIANDMTYTFYRGLDDLITDFQTIGPFNGNSNYKINVKTCTNHDNWLKFKDNSTTPINDVGWTHLLKNIDGWVTPINRHPSLSAVIELAEKIAGFIKTKNVY